MNPSQDATSGSGSPDHKLIIIPVRSLVIFPGVVTPVTIGRPRSVNAFLAATKREQPFGFVLQKESHSESPKSSELFEIGTSVHPLRALHGADGPHHCISQGKRRFRVLDYIDGEDFLEARVEWLEDEESDSQLAQGLWMALLAQAEELLEKHPSAPANGLEVLRNEGSISHAVDVVASLLDIDAFSKQEILEAVHVPERIRLVSKHVATQLELVRISREITEKTDHSLREAEREHYLREQLKSIRKELGDDSGSAGRLTQIREKLAAAELPEEAKTEVDRELDRLEAIPEHSAEYSMIANYLETMADLPWRREEPLPIDMSQARQILDEDHSGLEKVKRRILEFLAVRKLNPEGKSPILCLVGPPGVGKTSLGRSLARATKRPFQRISLGGVHDEADIRGHRRTYVGALPGNIIECLRRTGSTQSVFLLDEIDKLGRGPHGDPASALLEVLDPEQNHTFRDHYLAVPFDLSEVFFVATANSLDTIPAPLRDRCEVIELAGYTLQEKREIAERYLISKQLKAAGLDETQCRIDGEVVDEVVQHYTREAGCRGLERAIAALVRRAAMTIAEDQGTSMNIDLAKVSEILGPRRFERDVRLEGDLTGVATGLAWTPAGGDVLFVEAAKVPGKGRLVLTGQLGDVMKESAQAALSLVKSKAEALRLKTSVFESSDIHVHVPAGAVPKDGPSAGVSMLSALVSLLTETPLRSDTAMSGEISLRGLILPVGGIKEKVIAAANAGLERVILPERNRRDLVDVPQSVQDLLEIEFVERVDQLLELVLDLKPDSTTEISSMGIRWAS